MKSWSGAMESSLGVDFGVEYSQLLLPFVDRIWF